MTSTWDLLIKGAKLFDGSGEAPVVQDVAVREGRVVARGENLPAGHAEMWWKPPASGCYRACSIYTPPDLEVDVEPALPESFGTGPRRYWSEIAAWVPASAARSRVWEPIVDCFTRVENIPKAVLRKVSERSYGTTPVTTWITSPNCPWAPMSPTLPHSMLRVEVMGLEASVSQAPARRVVAMEGLLETAMQQGYLGLADGLPFHYLSNDPNQQTHPNPSRELHGTAPTAQGRAQIRPGLANHADH